MAAGRLIHFILPTILPDILLTAAAERASNQPRIPQQEEAELDLDTGLADSQGEFGWKQNTDVVPT